MRCDGIKLNYDKVFNIDAAKTKNFRINLPFIGMGRTDGCGVKSVVLRNLNDPTHVVEYDT